MKTELTLLLADQTHLYAPEMGGSSHKAELICETITIESNANRAQTVHADVKGGKFELMSAPSTRLERKLALSFLMDFLDKDSVPQFQNILAQTNRMRNRHRLFAKLDPTEMRLGFEALMLEVHINEGSGASLLAKGSVHSLSQDPQLVQHNGRACVRGSLVLTLKSE